LTRLLEKNLLMVNLNQFIHVYENVLDLDDCNFLISLFEKSIDFHETIENESKPNFTQYNFTKNLVKFTEDKKVEDIHNLLIKKTFEYRDKYYDFTDSRVFPTEHALEQFRIKRYNTGGHDMFDTHVDVMNYDSARRFLSFFWYLNNVEKGGETEFTSFKIKPKQGTLVVFPPLWMFPHRGNSPISESKYLLSTYLHYK
jgi:prolyl 4-hydroxylase